MDLKQVFFKMEATGNDYIYFDFLDLEFHPSRVNEKVIPLICDRRFGVGADGIVVIAKSDIALAKMWMWNSDGSYSKICGNALRSVGLYLFKKYHQKDFLVESGVGIHQIQILNDFDTFGIIKVDMGEPILDVEKIPYKSTMNQEQNRFYDPTLIDKEGIVVSMGNPHCVFFVEDAKTIPLKEIGPKIEHHSSFPERTNVEFVEILEDKTLYQRTWERGSGETLACGSGACAVLVASVIEKGLPRKNTIHLDGGDLEIEWNENTNHIYMTGKAKFVYKGELMRDFFLFW